MQDGYYSQFIDPTSEYQKAWLELAELKQAYLDQRVVVANLTEEETDEKIFQEVQKLESLRFGFAQRQWKKSRRYTKKITAGAARNLSKKQFSFTAAI